MAESSSEPSMYVRVKRKKTAIFLMVEPTDTASDLKIKIHHITKVATTDMKLYLDAKGEVQLDETKSLADQKARRLAGQRAAQFLRCAAAPRCFTPPRCRAALPHPALRCRAALPHPALRCHAAPTTPPTPRQTRRAD